MIYSIYYATEFNDLNTLLIGMLISKVGSTFASKVVMKWMKFKVKEYIYFYNCKIYARNQKQSQENGMKYFHKSNLAKDISHARQTDKMKKTQELYSYKNSDLLPEDEKLEYKRLITVFDIEESNSSYIENEPYFLD